MYNPAFDLAVLSAMLDDYEEFIKSDVVLWQLSESGGLLSRFPKLTVGGLLLVRQRISGLQASFSTQARQDAASLFDELDGKLDSWRANLERKALAELNLRFNSWAWYLDDCDDSPANCDRNYAGEVYARTYLKFLLDLLAERPEAEPGRSRLQALDIRLRKNFAPGGFVWDESLRVAFPQSEFWFLHGFPAY